MKAFIQNLLGVFGVRLIRKGNARKYLPKPNIDNIEIIIRFYSLMKQKIKLLQIGACDGVTSDSIYPYIKQGNFDAYLVEPSASNFRKLSAFYQGVSNATLIQAAVADKDEVRSLYTVKDEGRWTNSGWARQLASFSKQHLLKHNILENEIQTENVKCLTLQTIMQTYNISNLDVLLIDTEGYDGDIVKMALAQGINPTFLAFENAQLVQLYSQAALDELYSSLAAAGYVWTHDRINSLAIREDFFLEKQGH